MQLKCIEIEHYRALRTCIVEFGDSTALVGQNGAGKSSVLQAILYFFDPSGGADEDDQAYGSDDSVSVTAVLTELTEVELGLYVEFLGADQELRVTKTSRPGEPVRYSVRGSRFPGFSDLRELEHEKASVYSVAYKDFVDKHPEFPLGKPRAAADCKAELIKWEKQNPDRLVEADVPFTFDGTTRSQLIPTTRLIYVPAVHDAAEDFRGGKSPLGQMIDALVTTQLDEKPAIVALRERWDAEYQQVLADNGDDELDELASRLTSVFSNLVPGASITFSWQEAHPEVPLPGVLSQINEDGVPTDIGHQGHGMQRALIMALLQAYDEHIRSKAGVEGETTPAVHIMLLIEEPELYQHPPRARHISRVLKKLASETSGKARFRVISTTHSPNFVSVDDLESIRIVRKEHIETGIPLRRISALTLGQVSEAHARATGGKPQTEPELRRSLHVLDSALREAFFANSVVLTEGVGDIGVLNALCSRAGVDLEAKGSVLTSISGKGLIPIAIVILTILGIPHFVIFDSDSDAQLAGNQTILRLLNAASEDIPAIGTLPTTVRSNYAVLSRKMEDVARSEFGNVAYDECIAEAAHLYGRQTADVMKNPVTAAYVIDQLSERGLRSATFDAIIERLSSFPLVDNNMSSIHNTKASEKRKR